MSVICFLLFLSYPPIPSPLLSSPPCATPVSQSALLRGTVGEGLAKLLLSGRVVSRRILAKLILLWYNPVTQDEDRLRGALGVFFQAFATQGRYEWARRTTHVRTV